MKLKFKICLRYISHIYTKPVLKKVAYAMYKHEKFLVKLTNIQTIQTYHLNKKAAKLLFKCFFFVLHVFITFYRMPYFTNRNAQWCHNCWCQFSIFLNGVFVVLWRKKQTPIVCAECRSSINVTCFHIECGSRMMM